MSDPRAALRAAIRDLAQAESDLAYVVDRSATAHARRLDAMRAQDAARQALAEAQADGQRERTAHLLGTAQHARTLEELRRAADDAESALRATQDDIALLDAEASRRRANIATRKIIVDESVAAVLRPTAHHLVTLLDGLHQRIADIAYALEHMPPGARPLNSDLPTYHLPDPDLARSITRIAASLRTDPDIALPASPQPLALEVFNP